MGCYCSCTRSASRQSPSGTTSDPPWNDTYEINCQVSSLVAKHWFQHRGNSASMSSLPSNSSKPACGTCLPMVLSCRTMAKVTGLTTTSFAINWRVIIFFSNLYVDQLILWETNLTYYFAIARRSLRMSWLFIHERKGFPPITMTSNLKSDTTSNIQGALNALCSITRTAILTTWRTPLQMSPPV